MNEYDKWLKNRLSKGLKSPHYDPDGNSSRAVITRGLKKEILYQFKKYPKSLKCEIKSFNGFDSSIGYFINIFLIIFLAPLVPMVRGIYSHRRAIRDYRKMFEESR